MLIFANVSGFEFNAHFTNDGWVAREGRKQHVLALYFDDAHARASYMAAGKHDAPCAAAASYECGTHPEVRVSFQNTIQSIPSQDIII